MQRLLQGDVGSGKTVVACIMLLAAVENGFQGALMAPTEILAQQHYENFVKWLAPYNINVGLFIGSNKTKLRKQIQQDLINGQIHIAIGTHALVQNGIAFNNLGAIVIDEQHRFGVKQRSMLATKGSMPQILTMTATPIPRTLSLTMHGDLDLSIIDELPQGRKPIKTHLLSASGRNKAYSLIKKELDERLAELRAMDKIVEAYRLEQRVNFDIEMLQETGFCQGIENYSVYMSDRERGSTPYCLFDFLGDDFLTVVDESHVTIPQIGGMYNGDRARKESLVEHGFRLPSAMDNRPLNFKEWEARVPQVIFVSATPGNYEIDRSTKVVEQIIRPTGLLDPKIVVKETDGQIEDLIENINERVEKGERVLVTTLTKKMAEDLTDYLRTMGVKVKYMHSDVETLERMA